MNNATIAATVFQLPQLRYTQDNQTPVADFVVQCSGRNGQMNLKVTVWNDLAQAVVGLQVGAAVLLQGFMSMEKVEENGVNKTYPRLTAREVFQLPQLPTGLRPQPEGVVSTSLNSIQLVGRLGGEPDTRFFESGSVVSNVSLAVNRNKKDALPDWFPLVMWGKTAELAKNYLHKGSEIAVEGTFDYDTWSDRATGEQRFKPIIRVNNLKFVGSKRQESNAPVAQATNGAVPAMAIPAGTAQATNGAVPTMAVPAGTVSSDDYGVPF